MAGEAGEDPWGTDEFFEMSLDLLCVAGFDGYLKRVNPSWTQTLGWAPEELLARPSIEFVHPDDRAATLRARSGLREGEPLLGLVNRYLCKDGSYRWFEWRSIAHADRGLVFAAARDVTEQRDAQRALRALTESLTATLNSIGDGVIATDARGSVVRMNPVAETLTGWTSSEAAGRPLHDVLRLVDREAHAAANDTHLVRRDGGELPVACSRAPMKDGDDTSVGTVIVLRDLTSEKQAKIMQAQLQRQLLLADRMSLVGTLAAGVAHEINNPLAYVMVNLHTLIDEIKSTGSASAQLPHWEAIAVEALQGTERIRKIVSGLKTFSRADEERRRAIDLRPVLELSIDMTSNEIRQRARLVTSYGDTPPVEADDARLGQVFINLLVNAAQAVREGDTEANEIRVSTSTDALGRAVIEIRDTGPGIPESALPRLFDPFFTTKPVGVGTGLGLSICHSIITAVGGEITAGNAEQGGAVFRVTLPAAPSSVAGSATVSALPRAETRRRLRVLVIDDERAIGVALGRVLRDHDVTILTSAREALELLVSGADFDVILSDLMMPEMSGMELHDELARRVPRAAERMAFITGGAFTPAARAFLDRVPNARLEKPFEPNRVRSLVTRLAGA